MESKELQELMDIIDQPSWDKNSEWNRAIKRVRYVIAEKLNTGEWPYEVETRCAKQGR